MCYIGHEGTYTPAHREMCASLGQNIMVEASSTVSQDGKAEKPGSSIWFMTESKDRHTVSEYWLSVLGHDIEVVNHFAQVVAWKKAPFNVYVVEQRPGDFILIPPLAPHQVWNRGTRTMKVAWNRTTVETLEMALNEALPRSRIVCRNEQYKNKAIIYYTLQKYASLLSQILGQAARISPPDAQQLFNSSKIKQIRKDFKRLFNLYKEVLLTEMFHPDDRDTTKANSRSDPADPDLHLIHPAQCGVKARVVRLMGGLLASQQRMTGETADKEESGVCEFWPTLKDRKASVTNIPNVPSPKSDTSDIDF